MRVVPADSESLSTCAAYRGSNIAPSPSSHLMELQQRIARHFSRPEPRERAGMYLTGLLSGMPRKNGHNMAEFAHEKASDGMQRLLTTAKWDVEAVRDELRSCVLEWFGDPRSLLVVGQASFIKRGHHSAGVHQQFSETSGRMENCQIGLFLGYVSPAATAFIDRELYLPDAWHQDASRCARAGIPEHAFASRTDLARRMLRRAFAADVPASWVITSALADIGVPLHESLLQAHSPHVVEIRPTAALRVALGERTVHMAAEDLIRIVPARRWQGLRTRGGIWARLPLAANPDQGPQSWLLTRHNADSKLTRAYAAYGPASASLLELIRVASAGAAATRALARAKAVAGLDDYEARRYEAWYRHITLALMADAVAQALRSGASPSSAPAQPAGASIRDLSDHPSFAVYDPVLPAAGGSRGARLRDRRAGIQPVSRGAAAPCACA